jgi:hypothetical protein
MEKKSPKPQIRSLISEGQDLYNRYFNSRYGFDNSKVFGSIMKDIGSDWISDTFGIPKKYTRAIKRLPKTKWEVSSQYQQLMTEYQDWIDRSIEFCEDISEWSENLKSPGNSKKLIIKFNRLESKAKLDTKMRTGIAILTDIHNRELIYNSNLPKKVVRPKRPKKVSKKKKEKTPSIEKFIQQGTALIFKLETKLRAFIEKTMVHHYGEKWWKKGIPSDVRQNCKRRMKKNDSPFGLPKSNRKLDYADFSDYRKIILRKDNWRDIYQNYFGGQKIILEGYLIQLEELRNTIQHNRSNLNDRAILKLQLLSDDILNAIVRTIVKL